MNIVYMHTHDIGRYIQPYGYQVPTPNLMKFAKEGTLFRNAFCMSPSCSPSRAALLTGMCSHTNGMIGLAHRGFEIKDYNKHLVQYLNRCGYETVLCGIQHEFSGQEKENRIGYARTLHEKRKPGDDFTEWDATNAQKAAEYIRGKKPGGKPFFLSFGMINTHRPYPEKIDEDIDPDYVKPPFPAYDNEITRRDFSVYMTAAKAMDKNIGILLEAIKDSGLDEETLVFFTTDHGISFPRMKCTLFDTGIGVSLIMRYPGNKMKGRAVDSIVSHIDVFPTICDIVGLEKPEWLEGISFKPILDMKSEKTRHEIFAELSYHSMYEPLRCVRTERFKYIRRFDDYEWTIHVGGDGGASDKFVVAHGILEERRPVEMLFDLYLDPVERVNVADNPLYAEVCEDMRKRLKKWMEDTNDPLLDGFVPAPPGARISERSNRHKGKLPMPENHGRLK